jgi:flavin-binding protein dodecin
MTDHVYKIIELVGSSDTSIEDAIQRAITKATESLRHMRWFEVKETRGQVENGRVKYYQVTLKAGFTLEGDGGHLQP